MDRVLLQPRILVRAAAGRRAGGPVRAPSSPARRDHRVHRRSGPGRGGEDGDRAACRPCGHGARRIGFHPHVAGAHSPALPARETCRGYGDLDGCRCGGCAIRSPRWWAHDRPLGMARRVLARHRGRGSGPGPVPGLRPRRPGEGRGTPAAPGADRGFRIGFLPAHLGTDQRRTHLGGADHLGSARAGGGSAGGFRASRNPVQE